jgi:hypothetical protein
MAMNQLKPNAVASNYFSITFNIETLRLYAYSALVGMVLVGVLVTKAFVTKPLEETVIFHHFGFNHICNVFDHQPSRTVSALLILFFIVPMALFVVLSYFRTRDAVREGRVAPWVHRYSAVTTPFIFLSVCYTYMWFVESPDEAGFVPHYIPYVMLQLAIGLLAINEVAFLRYTGTLPFGVSRWVADAYLVVLITTTLLCQLAVFSLLLGVPILDSPHDETQRMMFQALMYSYSFLAIVMPIPLAIRNRKNGNINTITFG